MNDPQLNTSDLDPRLREVFDQIALNPQGFIDFFGGNAGDVPLNEHSDAGYANIGKIMALAGVGFGALGVTYLASHESAFAINCGPDGKPDPTGTMCLPIITGYITAPAHTTPKHKNTIPPTIPPTLPPETPPPTPAPTEAATTTTIENTTTTLIAIKEKSKDTVPPTADAPNSTITEVPVNNVATSSDTLPKVGFGVLALAAAGGGILFAVIKRRKNRER